MLFLGAVLSLYLLGYFFDGFKPGNSAEHSDPARVNSSNLDSASVSRIISKPKPLIISRERELAIVMIVPLT